MKFVAADKHADGPTSGRRLAFARHLVSGQHPLLGRVLVNRIWLQHFGRGLVDSPGDFGRLGLRPTHPELLDWLATELPQRRWSLKSMHRLIMLSTTYRQSSTPRADQSASQPADPRRLDGENSLYWHFPVRRLEAEALRDRVLAVSGRLDRTQFGPPVAVVDDFVGQVIVKDETPRRSIYLEVLRTKPESFLTAFDAPVMTVNCEKRPSSAGAPQSLMLMNSEFVLRHSRDFAARVQKETPTDFARELTAPVAGRFSRTRTDWQYGFGEFDIATKRVAKFGLLPHFDGTTWGGTVRPDPAIGWALLWADGGHAGSDLQRSPIRRWTAPIDGVLTISGKLNHGSDSGDGVRGRIVSSRSGLAGEWSVKKSEAAANVSSLQVMAGDTIDFVTDCIGNVNADSFTWTADLKLQHPQHGERSWSSSADFHGPLTAQPSLPQQLAFAWQLAYQRPITAEELELAASFVIEHLATTKPTDPKLDPELIALTHVCQQLISSNEFLYVD